LRSSSLPGGGWVGSIHSEQRDITRGKRSRNKFESDCLAEYAQTFPTVGGDCSVYTFPSADSWGRTFGSAPSIFTFGLKIREAGLDDFLGALPAAWRYAAVFLGDGPAKWIRTSGNKTAPPRH
jgi:hypothetical protein